MSADALALSTTGLTKRFGRQLVVDDLELAVPQGAVYGFIGPKGMSREVVDRIYRATKAALSDPAVRKRIEDTGSLIVGNSPDQFATQIRAEYGVYMDVVAKQKLSLE